ncbi:MAG: adhesin [Nitrosospira sp.]|nr:adhesin [Nitrosospira sp.]GDX61516.1 hypothetical protein LBMAG32_10500 [Nitrosomonadaceae bacterium]
MKLNRKNFEISWPYLMLTILIPSLVACGNANDNPTNGKKLLGPTTGRLIDAGVGGVSYITSSKIEGITDEKGTYNYNHGDMVEFKLGSLSIGKVTAAAIVTPIDLAGESIVRLENLLVLLQSLDGDGNPENGIIIPINVAAAVDASINLDSDPAIFISSDALQVIRRITGIVGTIKSRLEARNHFLSQSMNLLSADVWVKYDDKTAVMIRTSADKGGEYLQGEATPDDVCDANRVCGTKVSTAGVEYGIATISEFDTRGFNIIGKPIIDTNLKAGLSHPQTTSRIRTDGVELIVTEIVTIPRERKQNSIFSELFHISGTGGGTLQVAANKGPLKTKIKESRFSGIDNDPESIVGGWVQDTTILKTPTYLFFPNGKFMLVDPIGDPERNGHKSCGNPGVEFATYTHDVSSKFLGIKGFTYDTNGCAGFSGIDEATLQFSENGNAVALKTKKGTLITLHRISKKGY